MRKLLAAGAIAGALLGCVTKSDAFSYEQSDDNIHSLGDMCQVRAIIEG